MTINQPFHKVAASSNRKHTLLPQSSSPSILSFPVSYKRTGLLLIAVSSALLLLNSVNFQLLATAPSPASNLDNSPSPLPPIDTSILPPPSSHAPDHAPVPVLAPVPAVSTLPEDETPEEIDDPFTREPYNGPENESEESEENEDEEYRFADDPPMVNENEDEEEELGNESQNQQRPPLKTPEQSVEKGVIPPQCPSLFLSTEASFQAPSFTSSSTVPLSSTVADVSTLLPEQVSCRPIPSKLKDFTLAFCISNNDCSQGFIQVVHDVSTFDPMLRYKVSQNATHDQYFRQVAGPDDFYFLIQGAQKLALGAHLVPSDLAIRMDNNKALLDTNPTSTQPQFLVYRADFRMTLPGPIQLSGSLTYERFRAIRENRPGVWPQWSHMVLIDPETVIDPMAATDGGSPSTKFSVCQDCELDPFLEKLKAYRETNFQQCDRMAPVRGSYWREDVALKVYSPLDTINQGPGAGSDNGKTKPPRLTKGWRFVPNGCTMTKTSALPNAPSSDPYSPTCDSIMSPPSEFLPANNTPATTLPHTNPHRKVFFTGDSQVRATYNAILNHYRPIDAKHQRFARHSEFLPGLETLVGLQGARGPEGKPHPETDVPRKKTDTNIELTYLADQFLDGLLAMADKDLDKYDSIYINLGQWPASGPTAGGQWSTAQLLDRWVKVIERLTRWKESRAAAGGASRVIWAGQNAFPMRTDVAIRTKGDWRTNARLGYWDDWIETVSQMEGNWFRRMNSWQLTFPMVDQVTDKAHFQETDAIDALKIEALYKLDLCSKLTSDEPRSLAAPPSEASA